MFDNLLGRGLTPTIAADPRPRRIGIIETVLFTKGHQIGIAGFIIIQS